MAELLKREQMLVACHTFQRAVEYSVPLMLPSPMGLSEMSGSVSMGEGPQMIAINTPVLLNRTLTVHGEVLIHPGSAQTAGHTIPLPFFFSKLLLLSLSHAGGESHNHQEGAWETHWLGI